MGKACRSAVRCPERGQIQCEVHVQHEPFASGATRERGIGGDLGLERSLGDGVRFELIVARVSRDRDPDPESAIRGSMREQRRWLGV